MRRMLSVGRLMIMIMALQLVASDASGFTRHAEVSEAGAGPYGLSTDCTLAVYNNCAGWIWLFDDVEGAVWGAVFDPNDCPGGCATGGAVSEIALYSRCASSPGRVNGIGIAAVDAVGCRTALLYDSGPMSIVHCLPGDRWTTIPTPLVHLGGNPFAVTVTWGPGAPGSSNPRLATDDGIANLFCMMLCMPGELPGCALRGCPCEGWTLPLQNSFIYVSDINGDGELEDICALYGGPYSLGFPYIYPYGYLPNNLMISVVLDCTSPTTVEPASWGRVKALFE
jgi:hypothetical protein